MVERMKSLVTPEDFAEGAPQRLIGTEAEDHVSLPPRRSKETETETKTEESKDRQDSQIEAETLKLLLFNKNFTLPSVDRHVREKWLANGQRIYIDAQMFESCTAEQLGPKRALAGTLAGVKVIGELAKASTLPVRIFRRSATVDRTGTKIKAAGFHMNFLTPENKDLLSYNEILSTHAATRLYAWGGMVTPDGFTLSQKAHAYDDKKAHDDKKIFYLNKNPHENTQFGFRRIEDYSGEDSSPWGTFMALATTSVLLRVLEHPEQKDLYKRLNDVRLADPYKAIRTVSADTTCKETLQLVDGRMMTAIQIQSELAKIASEFGNRFTLPEDEQYAVDQWQLICRDLQKVAETGETKPIVGRVGWANKKLWLEKKNVGPLQSDNPEAVLFDMSWDCIYPKEGGRLLFARKADLMIVRDEEVMDLVENPPKETRAAVRGKYIQDPSYEITGISWHEIFAKKDGQQVKPISLHPYQTE